MFTLRKILLVVLFFPQVSFTADYFTKTIGGNDFTMLVSIFYRNTDFIK